MKKRILTWFMLGSFFLIMSGWVAVSPARAENVSQNTSGAIMDEEVAKKILENLYATTAIYAGGDEKWDCTYMVREPILTGAETNLPTQVQVLVMPKFTYGKYYIRHYDYLLTTSKGVIQGWRWLHSGEMIVINGTEPIPEKDETITVQISEWSKKRTFSLTNRIPNGLITPEQAFRKACAVHYQTFGTYPTTRYMFVIEFIDGAYWLVAWDDNDGIGGQCYLLVNAVTGEADAIKQDE